MASGVYFTDAVTTGGGSAGEQQARGSRRSQPSHGLEPAPFYPPLPSTQSPLFEPMSPPQPLTNQKRGRNYSSRLASDRELGSVPLDAHLPYGKSPLYEPLVSPRTHVKLETGSNHGVNNPTTLDARSSTGFSKDTGSQMEDHRLVRKRSYRSSPSSTQLSRTDSQTRRHVYRDFKGVLRDIWQPGDLDGSRNGELPGTTRHAERFRFLQHDVGPIGGDANSPPKYVILDDKACYDIIQSSAYTAKQCGRFWSHDFSTVGTVKQARPNRGRPALVSIEDGGQMVDRGDDRGPQEVGWVFVGKKGQGRKYYFTGERSGYQGVPFDTHASPHHKRMKLENDLTTSFSLPRPVRDRGKSMFANVTPSDGITLIDMRGRIRDRGRSSQQEAVTEIADVQESPFISARSLSDDMGTTSTSSLKHNRDSHTSYRDVFDERHSAEQDATTRYVREMETTLGEMKKTLHSRELEIGRLRQENARLKQSHRR